MKIKKILFLFVISLLLFNCSSNDNTPALNSENKIISFSISAHNEIYSGSINNNSKEITIQTSGLELVNSIVPNITISENATIIPSSDIARNFNQEVNYTVTAENGETSTYKVITENVPFSNEKKILHFEFNIDNETFIGIVDHNNLKIDVSTYKDISSISPTIEISENATITPSTSDTQNFNDNIEYTITAQNGTSNTYTVYTTKAEVTSTVTQCYIRATSFGRVTNLDISNLDYNLYLENGTNSYLLNYFDLETWDDNGVPTTNFYFYFDENIITSTDYKLRLKKGGQIKAETSYTVDVLAENAPKIVSANQTEYGYGDTLLLTGSNLLPGIRIPANSNIYVFGESHVSVNTDKSILQLTLNNDRAMFPSFHGEPIRPTRVNIYYNDRYADSIILDFN